MNRHLRHPISVPADWRETLAQVVPALRARNGLQPFVPGAVLALGDPECEVTFPDLRNDCAHSFVFDHFPTERELAACERAVYAPHN